MEFLLDLLHLAILVGPVILAIAIIYAIFCYGISMIRLWFKF